MRRIRWSALLHIYQPPHQDPGVVRKVSRESYEKILTILEANPRARLTLNINAVLTEQLVRVGKGSVVRRIRALAERGRIELTGSAKDHVILPLLPPTEAVRQIRENERLNRKLLGPSFAPKGFFLPELCYSERVGRLLDRLGYRWIILDELAFSGALGDRRLRFDRPYRLRGTGLRVFFRHRIASDLFFSSVITHKRDFLRVVSNDRRLVTDAAPSTGGRRSRTTGAAVVTACDGENFGHHHPGLDRVLGQLLKDPRIDSLTLSEWDDPQGGAIRPLASSWSSRAEELRAGVPYILWQNPKNRIHRLQWQLAHFVLSQTRGRLNRSARASLDEALHSDQYWWASAAPWFGLDWIRTGANRLVTTLERAGAPAATVAKGKALRRKILDVAKDWLDSGYANYLRKAYLAGEPLPRMFGGKRISS